MAMLLDIVIPDTISLYSLLFSFLSPVLFLYSVIVSIALTYEIEFP